MTVLSRNLFTVSRSRSVNVQKFAWCQCPKLLPVDSVPMSKDPVLRESLAIATMHWLIENGGDNSVLITLVEEGAFFVNST